MEAARARLLDLYSRVWALDYASALMGWDSETYMPEGAAEERGEASALLKSLKQSLLLSREFREAFEAFRQGAESDVDRGIVRVLERELRYYERVPEEVIKELERVTNRAKVERRKAKKRSEFSLFAPYLEKIVDLNRKIAEYLGYEKHPYDALLDLYEEGFTTADADRLFSGLEKLSTILKKVQERGWPSSHPLEEKEYDVDAMKSLNRELLTRLGFDWNHMRLDESAHPFTENIGLYDVRITTWYHGKDFRRSLLAVVHEFGHAMYERGCDPSLWKTPVCGGVSLGVHESQSRFWENIVGRSEAFASFLEPLVKEYLHIDADARQLFEYFNVVKPSFIRVEADEVTYNLHILVRYTVEKELIEGSLEVSELPARWNELMERYLGITPPNDALGALQDIHWSLGMIGYFPTYSIGTVLAAQIKHAMEKDLPLYDLVERGDFSPILQWLRKKIHRWGSVYPPAELVRRATGEELTTDHFINYLKEKYLGG